MKELSIQEKAQRYDEAIIRGSQLWESDAITRENYEYIFPELKENEDEKIRKEIIRIVDIWTNSSPVVNGIPSETLLAWLEKKGKQKSAWSEEDEKMVECCEIALEAFENLGKYSQGFPHENYFELNERIYPSEVNRWLKSLKERVKPKQKQELNEDTQQWIDAIIKDYEEWYKVNKDHSATIQIKINILKSLKERYTWKPSEEQLETLENVRKILHSNKEIYSKINHFMFNFEELIRTLKKLREE